MRQAMRVVLWLAIPAFLTVGCGSPQVPTEAEVPAQQRELTDLNEAYRVYLDQKKQPPGRAADLRAYAPAFPLVKAFMNQTKYAVLWGTNPEIMPDAAGTVLAYETTTPAQGGWALMADGSVKQLSAEEFQAARKPPTR